MERSLASLGATELAALLRGRDLPAREVLEACLALIDSDDAELLGALRRLPASRRRQFRLLDEYDASSWTVAASSGRCVFAIVVLDGARRRAIKIFKLAGT
jgi:Asp-tRNA(Asn)/Glu-tRNA(Gln) amidotransferase A subunit family amidase